MAFAPGPRNKAANVASNPLSASTPWVASTAFASGTVLTNAGSSYSVNAPLTTPATFNTTGLTLIAGVGAPGAAAAQFSATITWDGTSASQTVTHGLGTKNLVASLHDPSDVDAVITGPDVLFPTTTTAQVVVGANPANGTQMILILR